MTKIKEIGSYLESIAPLAYQESYDNAGLIVGDPDMEVSGLMVCLDSTEEVIEEAIDQKCNLVVAHHPIIFSGLRKLTGENYVEKTVIKAIRNGIGIYAAHTNLDNIKNGVNKRICEKLSLTNLRVMVPKKQNSGKLVTFTPKENTTAILNALHTAGAGSIGDYENCSFTIEGTGRFRPGSNSDPHIGEAGNSEAVTEDRIEVIFPVHRWKHVYDALLNAHPYEEVAYYYTELQNHESKVGAGMVGDLETEMLPVDFLGFLKDKMELPLIRHTKILDKPIKRVAVCGGSGSFMLPNAIAYNAEIFITADLKYHQFFDSDKRIILADIGHYESEVFTKDLLGELLTKKFNTFAVNLSKAVTNPIQYY